MGRMKWKVAKIERGRQDDKNREERREGWDMRRRRVRIKVGKGGRERFTV